MSFEISVNRDKWHYIHVRTKSARVKICTHVCVHTHTHTHTQLYTQRKGRQPGNAEKQQNGWCTAHKGDRNIHVQCGLYYIIDLGQCKIHEVQGQPSCRTHSLVPRPFEEGDEKGPGTHGQRMRQYLPESIYSMPLHQQATCRQG